MQLIDADALEKYLNEEYYGMISDESMKIYKILQLIEQQPTAYNVEKVVEELVDTFGDDICEMEGNFECDADIPCDECKRNRMLELVRRGGVE